MTYEPHKTSMEELEMEAIQTAAMAIRFAMSLREYKFYKSTQHEQHPLEDFSELDVDPNTHPSYNAKLLPKETKVMVMSKIELQGIVVGYTIKQTYGKGPFKLFM